MSLPSFDRVAKLIRATATLEIPFRSVADCYTAAPPLEQAIPNVVYQTWVEPRLGRRHARELKRFREMNAEYSFELFDDDSMGRYMEERYAGEQILEVYKACIEGPARTDIWRYCMLLDRGGCYFDINKMVNVPLSQFIGPETRAVLSMEREGNVYPETVSERAAARFNSRAYVLTWGLAFAPGHPILRRAIDSIAAELESQRGVRHSNLKWASVSYTGPLRLTRSVIEAIDANEDDGVVITTADFDGHGVSRVPGSWARFLARPHYRKQSDVVLIR